MFPTREYFVVPFIATFNIAILIAMIFDHEVRVKVYRRYLLALQVKHLYFFCLTIYLFDLFWNTKSWYCKFTK